MYLLILMYLAEKSKLLCTKHHEDRFVHEGNKYILLVLVDLKYTSWSVVIE